MISIDGYGPLEVSGPESVAELGGLTREAISRGDAIYAIGGRTALDLGNPPTRPGRAFDLRGLDQVIDYPARDMTITVQAGVTVGRMQVLLATEKQRVAVDFDSPSERTVGGVLATNASGPRRYGFGTLRDHVIGISFVNGEGREAKAGGRVVKNVAGYDLCKLHIGALGTLGIITQVTFKVRPIPEESAIVIIRCERGRLSELLDLLHQSSTRPVCLELINTVAAKQIAARTGATLPEAAWVVAVGFEDNRSAVGWQVQQIVRELTPKFAKGLEARVGGTSNELWAVLAEGIATTHPVVLKANVLPSRTGEFCERVADLGSDVVMQAHAGNGIVNVGYDGIRLEDLQGIVDRLVECSGADGNVIVRRCPPAWKTTLAVWGKPRADGWLMQKVKHALDPHGVFNPGRFMASI